MSSVSQSRPTLCDPMDCSTARIPVLHYLPELPSSLSHPLLLPSVFSSIRVFSNESVLHTSWPKYWSFSPLSLKTARSNFSVSYVITLTSYLPTSCLYGYTGSTCTIQNNLLKSLVSNLNSIHRLNCLWPYQLIYSFSDIRIRMCTF